MATLDIVSIVSDIAGAGTALAGLILVYLGAVAVRYETLDSESRGMFTDGMRGEPSGGIVIALVAAIATLTAKSLKSEPYANMIEAMAGLASHVVF